MGWWLDGADGMLRLRRRHRCAHHQRVLGPRQLAHRGQPARARGRPRVPRAPQRALRGLGHCHAMVRLVRLQRRFCPGLQRAGDHGDDEFPARWVGRFGGVDDHGHLAWQETRSRRSLCRCRRGPRYYYSGCWLCRHEWCLLDRDHGSGALLQMCELAPWPRLRRRPGRLGRPRHGRILRHHHHRFAREPRDQPRHRHTVLGAAPSADDMRVLHGRVLVCGVLRDAQDHGPRDRD
mmetsp:Transcript_67151/g.173991  ORF Transcript_67151/g.173991 Transcript_67151/m.173991 type:complete len:235 (-) Transcript_67151:266-970(-)